MTFWANLIAIGVFIVLLVVTLMVTKIYESDRTELPLKPLQLSPEVDSNAPPVLTIQRNPGASAIVIANVPSDVSPNASPFTRSGNTITIPFEPHDAFVNVVLLDSEQRLFFLTTNVWMGSAPPLS